MNLKTTNCVKNLILVFIISTTLKGQVNNVIKPTINLLYNAYAQDSTINFKQIQDNANAYFTEYHTLNGPTIPKAEKQYKRWEYFWRNKLNYQNPNQTASINTHKVFANKLKSSTSSNCLTPAGNSWQSLGPNSMATANQGIIQAVGVNPNDANILFAGSYTSGLFKSTNGGVNWFNVTDVLHLPSMGVISIVIDKVNPNNMLIATGNGFLHGGSSNTYGILRSVDGGDNWTSVLNTTQVFGLNIEILKYDDTNPSIVYAGGDNQLFKSIDGGATWGDFASAHTNGQAIFTNPLQQMVINNATPILHFIDIEIDNLDHNIIYASSKGYNFPNISTEIWVSLDAGATWNNRTPGVVTSFGNLSLPNGDIVGDKIAIDITKSDPGVLYAAVNTIRYNTLVATSRCQILKSIDKGLSWVTLGDNPNNDQFGYWYGEFDVSNVTNQIMYLSGLQVKKSIDGGQSFPAIIAPTSTSIHGDNRYLKVYEPNGPVPAPDVIFEGNDGGLAKSIEGLSVISLNGNGLNITQFYGFDDKPIDLGVNGGAQDNSTLHMDNAGVWNKIGAGDGAWAITDDVNPNIVYGAGNSEIYKSTDGGINNGSLGNPDNSWNLWMKTYLDPFDHTKFYFLRNKLYLHNGTAWSSKVIDANVIDNNLAAMAIAPCNNKIMFVAFSNPAAWNDVTNTGISKQKFYKSNDGGLTFTDISSNAGLNTALRWWTTTDIIVDPNNQNHLYCSFNGYKQSGANPSNSEYRVLESIDGGNTFNDISSNLPPYPVSTLEYQKGTNGVIFAGTDIGVYRYDPTTQIWECFNKDMPLVPITNIEINYCRNKIYASTFGRGIWQSDLIVAAAPINVCGSINNVCPGTPVTLSVSGGISYVWAGGQTATSIIVSPNATTNYAVTANNICGGQTTSNITINVSNVAPPALTINASLTSLCSGFPVTLTANGGVGTYTWQPLSIVGNPITVIQNNSTTYTVYANGNSGGCIGEQNIVINSIAKPTIVTTANAIAVCENNLQPVTLTATGGVNYQWLPGNLIGNTVLVTPNTNTNYQVIVTDANGCVNQAYITVKYGRSIVAGVNVINQFCSGPNADGQLTATPSGGNSPYTYLWAPVTVGAPAQTTATIKNLPTGTYNLTITDAFNCQFTTSAFVDETHNPVFDYEHATEITNPNEIWSLAPGATKISANGLIIVKAGAKLTIPNGVLVEFNYFKPTKNYNGINPYGYARLQVEAGGLLVVEPTATLTGCNGGVWEGLELLGTGNLGGVYPNTMFSQIDGYIHNAEIGVLCTRRVLLNERPLQVNGGHFTSNGAHFLNNGRAIEIPESFDGFNYSITNCNFNYTANVNYYLNATATNYPTQIYASNNVKLQLQSNVFIASGASANIASNSVGVAIQCFDCELNATSNAFRLFKRAIEVNHSGTKPLQIMNNTFFLNLEGIYMQGTNDLNTSVKFNVLTLRNAQTLLSPKTFGIFAVGCRNFVYEGNTFSVLSGSLNNINAYGMVIDNSGFAGGALFNNTINKSIGYGIQTQNDNSNLTIRCNKFINPNLYSLSVVNVSGQPTATLKDQGRYDINGLPECSQSSYPAGNEWNYTFACTGEKNVFADANVGFKYQSHSNTNTIPTCSTPAWFAAYVVPNKCNSTFTTLTSCNLLNPILPPRPPATGYAAYYTAIKNLINQYQLLLRNYKLQYQQALAAQNGGNTQNLLTQINNPNKPIGQLKNTLTSSGALSDEVLIAFINRQPTVAPGILKDVLVKQAPLSLAVYNALLAINLPSGIRQNINSAQSNVPLYVLPSAVLSQLNYTQGEVFTLEAEYQRTKIQQTGSICAVFCADYNDVFNNELLANYYINNNQPLLLQQTVGSLQTDTTIALLEKQNLLTYYNTVANVLTSNKTVYNADSAQLVALPVVELANTKASVRANTILKARNKNKINYHIANITANPNTRLFTNFINDTNEESVLANTGNFIVYPNPNKGTFSIKLNNEFNNNNTMQCVIKNIMGQTITTITKTITQTGNILIETDNIPKGIYTISVISDELDLGTSKLIIN